MPGRLVMSADGSLVFYSRYNGVLWTLPGTRQVSALELTGSYPTGTLTLRVYDCVTNTITATLYSALCGRVPC
jgi:hypothetical protein